MEQGIIKQQAQASLTQLRTELMTILNAEEVRESYNDEDSLIKSFSPLCHYDIVKNERKRFPFIFSSDGLKSDVIGDCNYAILSPAANAKGKLQFLVGATRSYSEPHGLRALIWDDMNAYR